MIAVGVTGSQRLFGTNEMIRSWASALRHARHNRPGRAMALLERVLRGGQVSSQTLGRSIARAISCPEAFVRGPALTPLMKSPIPRHRPVLVLRSPYTDVHLSRRQVEGVGQSGSFDLMVDMSRQRVLIQGRDVDLQGRVTLIRILATLIQSGGEALRIDELFSRAWGRRFNPSYDSSTVYVQVCSLRRMMKNAAPGMEIISTSVLGYKMSPGLTYALIEEHSLQNKPSRAFERIFALVADREYLDNRSYREVSGVRRTTALRDLSELVNQKILVREGAGRGVRYRLAKPARRLSTEISKK